MLKTFESERKTLQTQLDGAVSYVLGRHGEVNKKGVERRTTKLRERVGACRSMADEMIDQPLLTFSTKSMYISTMA
jgi:hypothetical protein